MSDAAVELAEVTVGFERWGQTVRALDSVTVSIPAGQWVMLVGHNGSGKSTLLNVISGRVKPESGEIRIAGERLHGLSCTQVANKLFQVHQDPLMGTAPALTVFENLFVADADARNGKASRKDVFERYRDLLKPLGLADRLRQLARSLSGGERQLLALLVARLRQASVILLDEPLAALDPAKSELCMEQIEALNVAGKTIIQVTHDQDIAISKGHRTILLRRGQVVQDESKEVRSMEFLREAWAGGPENDDKHQMMR